MKMKVATRESQLARVQTDWVIAKMKEKHPTIDFEVVPITTKGDQILDISLSKVGGKGLFIKELEQSLLDGRADFAVHSLKDMPADLPEGLCLGAISVREEPLDALVSRSGERLAQLPVGAVVGTGSIRRAIQIEAMRPDIRVELLRGNVITRLKKLDDGQYDAIVLAVAGLRRLHLAHRITEMFDASEMLPAIGQGMLAIECREDFSHREIFDAILDVDSTVCATAERSVMKALGGGCSTPIAAYATVEGDTLLLQGMLANEDKTGMVKARIEGKTDEAEALGILLSECLKKKQILQQSSF